MAVPTIDQLKQVYGVAAEKAAERLKVLENRYIDRFGQADLEFFSAPWPYRNNWQSYRPQWWQDFSCKHNDGHYCGCGSKWYQYH